LNTYGIENIINLYLERHFEMDRGKATLVLYELMWLARLGISKKRYI
jgi:hypothetical protein